MRSRRCFALCTLFCLALAMSLCGCDTFETPTIVQPPPTPIVEPDLQPKADELHAGLVVLYQKVRDELKAEVKRLVEIAGQHRADVATQRKRVDEALSQYEKVAGQFLEQQEKAGAVIAGLQHQIEGLEGEAASVRKYETVFKIAGMGFAIVLLAVLWFGPTPLLLKPIKPYLMYGLIGGIVFGFIGLVLQRFARPIIIGGIVVVMLGVALLIVYVVWGSKLKNWLSKTTRAISESSAGSAIAAKVRTAGTTGMTAEILDGNGTRVEPRSP